MIRKAADHPRKTTVNPPKTTLNSAHFRVMLQKF